MTFERHRAMPIIPVGGGLRACVRRSQVMWIDPKDRSLFRVLVVVPAPQAFVRIYEMAS